MKQKYLFILPLAFMVLSMCGLFVSTPASAATKVSQEEANNFYNACRQQRDERMREATQDAFCACTAAKIMEEMSVEDVNVMREQSQAGRNMLNKMMIDVYAPCMNFPVSDLVEAQCMANEKVNAAGLRASKENICLCTAQRTADWFTKDGRRLMRDVVKKNPNILDPISPVMESKKFQSQSFRDLMGCLQGGGR